jgi:hypothetical protein
MSVADTVRGVLLSLCLAYTFTGVSLSQTPGPSATSQANSLPLSGRPQGNGSVTLHKQRYRVQQPASLR